MDRRHFMKHAMAGAAVTTPGLSFLTQVRAKAAELKKKQKSLIILWMGGGPSHMDLWDVKDPNVATAGEFKRIKTPASGVEISEILPETAKVFDKLSIVRNLVTNEGSHERGTTLMNVGRQPNPVVSYPALGSVVSMQLTSKDLALPGFIGIGGTAQRIGPGFLGMTYAPFTVQQAGARPANIEAPGLGDPALAAERMRRRQRLFYDVEDRFNDSSYPHVRSAQKEETKREEEVANLREALGSPAQAHTTVYKKAFDLTVSRLKDVFDVSKESPTTIANYGGRQNGFGMGCLVARKLVEKGVPAVEIDLGGWDNHGNIFQTLRTGNGPRLDKGLGTMVKELVERGKWQDTVVVWMGEFGRTPRINQGGGRDHWGRCWSVVVGGGAIKGGVVHGSTSADGLDPAKDPARIGDLFATIYKGLGIDPATKVRDNLGRPLEIAEGKPIASLV